MKNDLKGLSKHLNGYKFTVPMIHIRKINSKQKPALSKLAISNLLTFYKDENSLLKKVC